MPLEEFVGSLMVEEIELQKEKVKEEKENKRKKLLAFNTFTHDHKSEINTNDDKEFTMITSVNLVLLLKFFS